MDDNPRFPEDLNDQTENRQAPFVRKKSQGADSVDNLHLPGKRQTRCLRAGIITAQRSINNPCEQGEIRGGNAEGTVDLITNCTGANKGQIDPLFGDALQDIDEGSVGRLQGTVGNVNKFLTELYSP